VDLLPLEATVDAEVKSKWIAALRSGKYTQGFGRLRSGDDCYCCLGVLCDVAGDGCWVADSIVPDPNHSVLYVNGECSAYAVPQESLQYKLGIAEAIKTLWLMNDLQQKSFNEIADYIEATL
jgi:hypothetical protein